jgi:hypothetical protein
MGVVVMTSTPTAASTEGQAVLIVASTRSSSSL